MLWKPNNQFLIVSADDELAWKFGGQIKDIIERWGPNHGIELKADTRAKGLWQIKGKEGGVTSKGCHGTVVGRPADDVCVDDLVSGPEDALSKPKMDMRWEFVKTSVYSRLRRHTKMTVVNTLWTTKDPCSRLMAMAKRTGEKWPHLRFKALCEDRDIDPTTGLDWLGRKVGEALFPEQVSVEQLRIYQKEMGQWWHAAWQQNPTDEEGANFTPSKWPRYQEAINGWEYRKGGVLTKVRRDDVFILIVVDWAASERKNSDFTCIGVFALLPDGNILVLEIVNERLGLEKSVPRLAGVCEKWRPGMVAVEAGGFQTTMAIECRKFWSIPEPRRIMPYGKSKLQKAVHAITLGQGGRIHLPMRDTNEPTWLEPFQDQLTDFKGDGTDDKDDMVDVLSMASTQAQYLIKPARFVENMPVVLLPGFQGFIGN